MLGKWDDVRNDYLPTLLETLRVADATVPVCDLSYPFFRPRRLSLCLDAGLVANQFSGVHDFNDFCHLPRPIQ